MAIPPHVKRLLPTLNIDSGQTGGMKVTITMRELRILVDALAEAEVDEGWYLRQYPDVRDGIARGMSQSATQHYRSFGFFEGRLPADPQIDEEWYRATNPDVAAAIRQGKWRTAKEHYIQCGYIEGRVPYPAKDAPPARRAATLFAPRSRV